MLACWDFSLSKSQRRFQPILAFIFTAMTFNLVEILVRTAADPNMALSTKLVSQMCEDMEDFWRTGKTKAKVASRRSRIQYFYQRQCLLWRRGCGLEKTCASPGTWWSMPCEDFVQENFTRKFLTRTKPKYDDSLFATYFRVDDPKDLIMQPVNEDDYIWDIEEDPGYQHKAIVNKCPWTLEVKLRKERSARYPKDDEEITNEFIQSRTLEFVDTTLDLLDKKTEEIQDLEKFLENMLGIATKYRAWSKLQGENLSELEPAHFVGKILNINEAFDIPTGRRVFKPIYSRESNISDPDPLSWAKPLEGLASFAEETFDYYQFMGRLEKIFSTYAIQKERRKYNVHNLEDWGQTGKTPRIKITPENFQVFLEKIKGTFGFGPVDPRFPQLVSRDSWAGRLEQINDMLHPLLRENLTCHKLENQTLIQGPFVYMSDIVEQECLKNSPEVILLAHHTLFLDADLVGLSLNAHHRMDMTLLAPTWHLEGARKIELAGVDGPKALPPNPEKDGAQGVDGTNGGNFLGIAQKITGPGKLHVLSRGGNGGDGQAGMPGTNGENGENAEYKREYLGIQMKCKCWKGLFGKKCGDYTGYTINGRYGHTLIKAEKVDYYFWFHGAPAKKGTDGRNGGKAGKAGSAGQIHLFAVGASQGGRSGKVPSQRGFGDGGQTGGSSSNNLTGPQGGSHCNGNRNQGGAGSNGNNAGFRWCTGTGCIGLGGPGSDGNFRAGGSNCDAGSNNNGVYNGSENGGNNGNGGGTGWDVNGDSSDRVTFERIPGVDGNPGEGGKGGTGGVPGRQIKVRVFKTWVTSSCNADLEQAGDQMGSAGTIGESGTTGGSAEAAPDVSEKPFNNNSFARHLNRFKQAAWVHRDFVTNERLTKFILALDRHEGVQSLFTTVGYLEECTTLVFQSYRYNSSKHLAWEKFYGSLQDRTIRLGQRTPRTEKELKVAQLHLYTTAFAQTFQYRGINRPILVLDLLGWLRKQAQYLQILREKQIAEQSIQLVQDTKREFEQDIIRQCLEAMQLIDQVVKPELERVQEYLANSITFLLEEIAKLIDDVNANIQKLKALYGQLKFKLIMDTFLGGIRIAFSFLVFLPQLGGSLASLSEGVFNVWDSLNPDKPPDFPKPPSLPDAIFGGLSEAEKFFADTFMSDFTQFTDKITEIVNITNSCREIRENFTETGFPCTITERAILGIKEQLEATNLGDNSTKINFTISIANFEKSINLELFFQTSEEVLRAATAQDLAILLKKKEKLEKQIAGIERKKRSATALEEKTSWRSGYYRRKRQEEPDPDPGGPDPGGPDPEKPPDGLKEQLKKQLEELNKILTQVQKRLNQILHVFKVSFKVYQKIKKDIALLKQAASFIKLHESLLEALHAFSLKVQLGLSSIFQDLKAHLHAFQNGLPVLSGVGLDVAKWKMRNLIQTVKLHIHRVYTNGFKVDEPISRAIDRLEAGMDALVKIYDQIQSLRDQKKLADYIATIQASGFTSSDYKDPELALAVEKLDVVVLIVLILQRHDIFLEAFKLWAFPFAGNFFALYKLPVELFPENWEIDTNFLILQIEVKITETLRVMEDIIKTLTALDQNLYYSILDTSCGTFPVFNYLYRDFKNETSRLLLGEEVIYAGLSYSPLLGDETEFIAIKFNEVQIRLNPHTGDLKEDRKLYNALREELNHYKYKMTFPTQGYYALGDDRWYEVSMPSAYIERTFAITKVNPVSSNGIWKKLRRGAFLLSPLVAWRVQITPIEPAYGYEPLQGFQGKPFNLEITARIIAFRGNTSNIPGVDEFYPNSISARNVKIVFEDVDLAGRASSSGGGGTSGGAEVSGDFLEMGNGMDGSSGKDSVRKPKAKGCKRKKFL